MSNTCLSFEDVLEIGQPQISEMERVGNALTVDEPGEYASCEIFSAHVRTVESALKVMYGIAAKVARKATDANEAAEVWGRMSAFCLFTLKALSELKVKFPHCGTPELWDLTLDYKIACDKRHDAARAETSCQTAILPAGLFQE